VGAASSREIKSSRLEAAPTTNTTCSFHITGKYNNWRKEDQCIAKTMRTAIKKGVDSYLVSDCTATMNGFFQWKTERKYRGKVVNHLLGLRELQTD
jgi:hypothetical protein